MNDADVDRLAERLAQKLKNSEAGEKVLPALGESYRQHASTLRNWFLVYGVGAPAAVIANAELSKKFFELRSFKAIIVCFLVATGIQMLLAILDKYSTSTWYLAEISKTLPNGHGLKLDATREGPTAPNTRMLGYLEDSRWWLHQNAISAAGDLLSGALFIGATLLAVVQLSTGSVATL